MAFITVTCPVCGGQAQIEAGRSVMCPYCANELNVPADAGTAFAQQGMQFAPPPVQVQPMPMQMQQTAAMPMPQAAQFMPQQNAAQYLYNPEQLREAQKKRKSWHLLNAGMLGVQTLIIALSFFWQNLDYDMGAPLLMGWLVSLPLCGFLSGFLRPDDAYIEKKPRFKSKTVQGIFQFLLGATMPAAVGFFLFVLLANIFGVW